MGVMTVTTYNRLSSAMRIASYLAHTIVWVIKETSWLMTYGV